MRKFKVNEDYFDTESSNMAYILGFWAADGNVSKRENKLELELSKVDYEILEKIRAEIDCERPVKIYQCANGYEKNKLYFYSKKIKEAFGKYGIVPNKTYSELFHFPYNLNEIYYLDYIRGFFDGDGSVKDSNRTLTFELNSINKKFLEDIQRVLKVRLGVETKISTTGMKNRKVPMYRLYCYGQKAKDILDKLYNTNGLYLERKYKKYKDLLDNYNTLK